MSAFSDHFNSKASSNSQVEDLMARLRGDVPATPTPVVAPTTPSGVSDYVRARAKAAPRPRGRDSILDGALIGGGVAAASPLATLAQYTGYDLPKQLYQARTLPGRLPIVGAAEVAASGLATEGRVALQATEVTPIRELIGYFMDGRKGFAGKGGDTRTRLDRNLKLIKQLWEDKFDLGYGATATAGSPFRHAAMIDSNGGLLDRHVYPEPGISRTQHNANVAAEMADPANREHYAKWTNKGNDSIANKHHRDKAFALLGDLPTQNMDATMASAYTNSATPYERNAAVKTGIRHLVAPRLAGLKASVGAIICRSGYCSRQTEDAFGLRNLLGKKDALPGHIPMRGDFVPKAIFTEGIHGTSAERVSAVKKLWTKGIMSNAKRKIGLGGGIAAIAGVLGAGIGAVADATVNTASKPKE